jgi:hypothetical protein
MFESPMRLKRPENDFSAWLKSIGEEDLAKEISGLDPYRLNLDGLR